MTLSDLLTALASNTKLYITLADKEGVPMITFNAAGYESVESDLGTRTVKKIVVVSQVEVTVLLNDAP